MLEDAPAATGLTTHDDQPDRRPAHPRHASRRATIASSRSSASACAACAIRCSCGSKARSCRRSPSGRSTSPCRPSRRARTCRASSPGSTPSTSRSTPRRCAARRRGCSRCSAPTPAGSRPRFRSSCRKRAPVSGVESLLEYQGRLIVEARAGATHGLGRGRRPGQVALPVLEGDLRLRRAQPALARDDPGRGARPSCRGASWFASPRTRRRPRSGRRSSAPTRSGSPSAPTRTRSSSRTWCATSR